MGGDIQIVNSKHDWLGELDMLVNPQGVMQVQNYVASNFPVEPKFGRRGEGGGGSLNLSNFAARRGHTIGN